MELPPDAYSLLEAQVSRLTGNNPAEFAKAVPLLLPKHYARGEMFNSHRSVCRYVGFILSGLFRIYYTDPETGEESNVFFFSENQFVVSFKSFVLQVPCEYTVEALFDTSTLVISFEKLQELYATSHYWERFGRRFAEACFNLSQTRTESFLFHSPEERYIKLCRDHPSIHQQIPLYHLSSYLGIRGPSLSRIRKRILERSSKETLS